MVTFSMITGSLGLSMGPVATAPIFMTTSSPFGHFAEHRVAVIKVRRGAQRHEKLAAVGAGAGVGHGQHTGAIVPEAGVKFVLELIARAAGPVAEGAAALNDKPSMTR
jgi:hypothetical protein